MNNHITSPISDPEQLTVTCQHCGQVITGDGLYIARHISACEEARKTPAITAQDDNDIEVRLIY